MGKPSRWWIEFNDGDSYKYTTEQLTDFLNHNKPQQLQDYHIKDVVRILSKKYNRFFDSGCRICGLESKVGWELNNESYCQKHYIQALEEKIKYAKEQQVRKAHPAEHHDN
jgi:hypothetical protein